jgi:hypothetical protein
MVEASDVHERFHSKLNSRVGLQSKRY